MSRPVIPGLDEPWSLAGARIGEWAAGISSGLMLTNFFTNIGQTMPILVITTLLVTFGLVSLRSQFPDEERGVRNYIMTKLGFTPPGIPAPASIEPNWSSFPIRDLPDNSRFKEIGLDKIIANNKHSN